MTATVLKKHKRRVTRLNNLLVRAFVALANPASSDRETLLRDIRIAIDPDKEGWRPSHDA